MKQTHSPKQLYSILVEESVENQVNENQHDQLCGVDTMELECLVLWILHIIGVIIDYWCNVVENLLVAKGPVACKEH